MQTEAGKWGRRRGRGKKKIKGKFVSLVDDDVSKRAKFLSFKSGGKNHFELWDWIYYTII